MKSQYSQYSDQASFISAEEMRSFHNRILGPVQGNIVRHYPIVQSHRQAPFFQQGVRNFPINQEPRA